MIKGTCPNSNASDTGLIGIQDRTPACKSAALQLFVYGCILGALLFACIYGVRVLNVTYADWLLGTGDLTQHYLGWKAFSQTGWMFPIGLTDVLSYPFATSLIYTDSIPLFALFFKALSPLLPATFQYFGLWALLCYTLQGGISALLLFRFVKNKILCLLGCVFFVVSMPILMRTFDHNALTAQWILLAAVALWLYDIGVDDLKLRCAMWGGMGFLCAAVHLYFVPMTGLILLGCMITDFCQNRKFLRCLLPVVCFIAVCAFFLWVLGAFYGSVDANGEGVGIYVANLNSLINPLSEGILLKTLPTIHGNYEGSAYLGAGILLLCVVLPVAFLRTKWKALLQNRKNTALLAGIAAVVAIAALVALGPDITCNGRVLFTIPYPRLILSGFAVFRASGRFIWIIFYLLLLFVLAATMRKLPKCTVTILLPLCLCVQIIDFSASLGSLHREFAFEQTTENSLMHSGLMQTFINNPNYRHIQYLDELTQQDYYRFADYALHNGMTVSNFYFARKSNSIAAYRQAELERVSNGVVSRDTVYIAKPMSGILLNSASVHWYHLNDLVIGVANEIPGQRDKRLPPNSMRLLSFDGRFQNNAKDTADGRVLYRNGLSYGPYISLCEGLYQIEIIGNNLPLCRFKVTTDAGKAQIPLQDVMQRENSIVYSFVLKEDSVLVEFVLENTRDADILIESMELCRLD